MKNFIITIIILSAIFVVTLTGCLASTDALRPTNESSSVKSSVYPLTTKVVMIDYPSDIVWCEDFRGHVWELYGCEDWAIGDIACLLMDDNGTTVVYDDAIMNARYQGTFEGWR